MAMRRTLVRLLRLRHLEEEQSRLELEAAVVARNGAAGQLGAAVERQARGRSAFVGAILSPPARTSAVLEMEDARREQGRLSAALQSAEARVTVERGEFLERRTGRRQVETLVATARREAEAEIGRRVQQMQDDWYGRRAGKTTRAASKSSDHGNASRLTGQSEP